MQTFLPLADIELSAKVLDKKRLWKQVIEAKQIINTLSGESEGWKNHPAVRMWVGYSDCLKLYFNVFLQESIYRGIQVRAYQPYPLETNLIKYPVWFGSDKFHSSHRSNLLRKNKEYYRQFGWTEPNNLPYHWPRGKED